MHSAGYAIVALISIIFVAVGFIDQRKTMRFSTLDEEHIEPYLKWFKWFHIFLGVTTMIGGLLMVRYGSAFQWVFFCIYYPLLVYFIGFFISARKFRFQQRSNYYWGMGILAVVLIFISFMFTKGNTTSLLIPTSEGIEITEMYGEKIPVEEIRSFALVEKYPDLTLRINGYADGKVQKGYFKTAIGEMVLVIANKIEAPVILINKASGEKVYYVPKDISSEEIFKQLQSTYPDIPSVIMKSE